MMTFKNELAYAVNNRNREKMNQLYKKMYDDYSSACFFEALRLTGSKEVAKNITNKVYLVIYKRIFEIDNILEDLLYLTKKYSLEYIEKNNQINDEYNLILKELKCSDDELDVFFKMNIYGMKASRVAKNKNGKSSFIKKVYNTSLYKLNVNKVKDILKTDLNYDDISNKIEMPDKDFFIREKKLLKIGTISLIIMVILALLAFVVACVPSGNSDVAEVLLYFAGLFGVIGIVFLFLSALKNKRNK